MFVHTRDFRSAMAALVGPIPIFSLTVPYFNAFVPIARQAGQAGVLGRLSLSKLVCVSGSDTKSKEAKKRSLPSLFLLHDLHTFS